MSSLLVNITSVLLHITALQETVQDKKSITQCRKDSIDLLCKLEGVQNENSTLRDKVLNEFKAEIGMDRFLDIAPALSRMLIVDPIKVSDAEYIIRQRENLYNLNGSKIKSIIKRIRKGFYDPSFGA